MSKLKEVLWEDIKKWPYSVLVEAQQYCNNHMQELEQDSDDYAFWYDVREFINQQIEEKKP